MAMNASVGGMSLAAKNAPGAHQASATTGHRLADAAASLCCKLNPSLHKIPPHHWAYELLHGVLAGDTQLVELACNSHAAPFDTSALTEPLCSDGQNLLHVTAIKNR